jgi:hypothetical protein
MKTLDRPDERVRTTPTVAPRSSTRTGMILALVVVLALALGGAIGWMIRGDGDGDIVLAGEGELTARQGQMLDAVRDLEQLWQDGDTDGILEMFTPNGTFEAFDTVYRVDDGTLAGFVDGGDWSSLDVFEPILVHGNEVLTFHRFGGQIYTESLTFTAGDDLLIVSHVIHT